MITFLRNIVWACILILIGILLFDSYKLEETNRKKLPEIEKSVKGDLTK